MTTAIEQKCSNGCCLTKRRSWGDNVRANASKEKESTGRWYHLENVFKGLFVIVYPVHVSILIIMNKIYLL